MRRNSEGVQPGRDLLPDDIAKIEKNDPDRLIAALEPLVLERRKERLLDVIAKRISNVAVLLDDPYDPHNGAAIARSCDAFGVQNLHVIERRRQFVVATTITRGSERWLDIHMHEGAKGAVQSLSGFTLVAASMDGELCPEDLPAIPNLCIVMGNERDGIQPDLLEACQKRVRVPMRGFVESLNVSVTTAILLSWATKGRAGNLSEIDKKRLYARGLYLTVPRVAEVLAERMKEVAR